MTFETPVETIRWVNNEYVLKSGPLVFAADLGATPTNTTSSRPAIPSRSFPTASCRSTVSPRRDARLWSGSLDGTTKAPAFGFQRVTVKTENPDQPWHKSPLVLQGAFNRMRGKYKVDLVPMGCTVLRRVTFPVGYVRSTRQGSTMVDENTSK